MEGSAGRPAEEEPAPRGTLLREGEPGADRAGIGDICDGQDQSAASFQDSHWAAPMASLRSAIQDPSYRMSPQSWMISACRHARVHFDRPLKVRAVV